MPTATLTSKGQITLPQEVRKRLRLKAGDRVDFEIDSHGEVRVRAAQSDIGELRGLLHDPRRRPVSLSDVERAVRHRGRR